MEAGWIKIYRKIKDSRSYSRGLEYLGAMVWLILNARHEDGWKDGRQVKRGQLLVSRQQLVTEWHVSEKMVRTILYQLESDSFLVRDSANRGTMITICNYDTYQSKENAEGQPEASAGPEKGQKRATNKNEINNNNHNACTCIREKLAPEVNTLFSDWLRMYSTVHNHGRELSEQAEASNLRKFMNLPEAQQIASLEWSIQRETKSVAIIDPEQVQGPAPVPGAPKPGSDDAEWKAMREACNAPQIVESRNAYNHPADAASRARKGLQA